VYKAIFSQYSNARSGAPQDFDALLEKGQLMATGEVFKFLSDFKVNKGRFKSKEGVKALLRLIKAKVSGDPLSRGLDLEGFVELMLQLGYFHHAEPGDVPAAFMPLLFERLKEASRDSQPMIHRMFEPSLPQHA